MDRTQNLIKFTRHLYYLVKMDAPLSESLRRVADEVRDKNLKDAVEESADEVEKGESLSDSMKKRPGIFPADYVRMVEAAVETDTLPDTLVSLAEYLEEVEKTSKAIKDAIVYPVLIFDTLILFVGLIQLFIKESIFSLYLTYNRPIPLIFNVFASPVILMILVPIGLLLTYFAFSGQNNGAEFFYMMPIINKIIRKAYLARMSRTMGLMLGTGLTLTECLRRTQKVIPFKPIADALYQIEKETARGSSLAQSLENYHVFPKSYRWIIKTGEQNEDLPEVFMETADAYERELKESIGGLVRSAEPIFITIVGAFTALTLMSFWLPFYNMVGSIE